MANVKNNVSAQKTRQQLLEAAAQVFAERGYHAATIKEITDRAGAALASVNYHFGDKSELYASVLRRIEADARHILPPAGSLKGSAPERLRQFIRHVVTTMLGRDRTVWERMLLARELSQPTPALEAMLDSVARPLHQELAKLVAEITGLAVRSEQVALATCSIVAQCVYHMEHQALLLRVHPQLAAAPSAERIADHIADFSLTAIGRQRPTKRTSRRK